MNIWLGPLMQSERSDEEAASRRRAASCISVQGLAVCQHRGELLLYPLFYSSLLSTPQCSFLLFYSSPLLHFLAYPLSLHFSCQFSFSFFAFSLIFIADLRLRYLLWNASVVNTKSGATWVFSKTLKKWESLARRGCEICTVACGMCVRVWMHMPGQGSCLCIWHHVHCSSVETRGSSVTCMRHAI